MLPTKLSIYSLLFIFVIFSQRFAQSQPEQLTLGFMPYMTANQLLEKYTPLAHYLSEEVGIPVTIEVAKDYATHLQQVGEDKLDIAFMGGNTYVVMVDKYGKRPLLARYEIHGVPHFHSMIIVREDSPLEKLADLKGKRVAFGSPHSTLSTLVPLYMLKEAGISLDKLTYDFLSSHENVVYGVLFGEYAAGAMAEELFFEYQNQGIKALAKSPEVSTHVFITRKDLPKDLRAKLQQALLNLKNHPQGKTVLQAIGSEVTGFVEVEDSDYEKLRTILQAVPAISQ